MRRVIIGGIVAALAAATIGPTQADVRAHRMRDVRAYLGATVTDQELQRYAAGLYMLQGMPLRAYLTRKRLDDGRVRYRVVPASRLRDGDGQVLMMCGLVAREPVPSSRVIVNPNHLPNRETS